MNRKKAAQFLREGKRKEARDALVQCIDITPQMALQVMNVNVTERYSLPRKVSTS